MKSAVFNSLAARELVEAVEYYDEARRGLGDEFLDEVERAIAFLDQYPEAAPKVGREVRRLLLARFPYSLIYRPLDAGQIRILAIAHQKRRPRYWTRRR
jgi:toxin ParE1/3/4